jgi:tetratricopeptide (TPR) repeat protein
VRFLAEEGLITQKGGRWSPSKDTPLEMSIPEGLRDVIGKRLSLISKPCNQVLSVASVIGRDFRLEVLKKVSGLSEEKLFDALEEAKKAAIMEEQTRVGDVRYRFAHAFFRQTLYEETIAPRRIRLHQQVARALEETYANRLEEHAAELAEHFSHSTDPIDLTKAVRYGEMAAKRASDVYAYGEAVRLLDQAVKVQEVLDPEDKIKRCDLLLDLCEALYAVPDAKRIHDIEAPAAFSLAESLGDKSRAVHSCYWVLTAILSEQGFLSVGTPQFTEWIERGDSYASAGTAERLIIDIYLGMTKIVSGDYQSGKPLIAQGSDLARRVGDRDLLFQANGFLIHFCSAPQHAEERIRLAEETWKSPRLGVSPLYLGHALMYIGGVYLSSGQRKRAEEVWTELHNLAERTGNYSQVFVSMGMDAILAVMDGRLDDVMDIVKRLRSLGKETGMAGIAHIYVSHPYVRSMLNLGTSLEELERDTPRGIPLYVPELCLVQSHLGRKEEVFDILEKNVVMRPSVGTADDETSYWVDTLYLEASVLAGHHKAAEILLNHLSGTGLYTTGYSFPTCIIRHLGGAAALLERHDEARKYYQEAIRVCTEMRFRPELALTRLQLAELLLEHYPDEKKEAMEHLDFAIKEFREMKMQPSLERALRHKDILKA